MAGAPPKRPIPRWAWSGLLVVLVFDVWWRGHTFGPTVLERTGLRLWPVVSGSTEPLDCDEAAYGYIGRRLDDGAILYRDLLENKPPVGYWLYEFAVKVGGADELTIRLLPIPLVLATIALIWWIALRAAGPAAGCLAALTFAILSTDPFLFGNGANLEHAQDLAGAAALAAMIRALASDSTRTRRIWLAAVGVALGIACGIKPVEAAFVPVALGAILLRRGGGDARSGVGSKLVDLSAFASGFGLVAGAIVGWIAWRGVGSEAYDAIIRYASALVTDTPPPPNAPASGLRLLVGNSDPRNGALPWPFGATDWLVWWGAGSWPLWVASVPAIGWGLASARAPRRLIAAWTFAAWVAVALPGQYWQHYYLLPTPGVALLVAIAAADLVSRARADRKAGRFAANGLRALAATGFVAAVAATAGLQVRDYLLVPATELTIRYKGGRQWVRLREIGLDLARRSKSWPDEPGLFVWGWQSPLYFYSGLDSPTRHFFANELLKAYASEPHPLIAPWVAEIRRDLEADPPRLIFVGDRPFPALAEFLRDRYRLSNAVPEAPVLWVEREGFRRPGR